MIYGSATNPGTIDLSVALSSTQGFTILGDDPDDQVAAQLLQQEM